MSDRQKGELARAILVKIDKCSYSNIRTAFFEVIEQQKFIPLSMRVISNNTFEIRAKDLTKTILYNGEFDPGSG